MASTEVSLLWFLQPEFLGFAALVLIAYGLYRAWQWLTDWYDWHYRGGKEDFRTQLKQLKMERQEAHEFNESIDVLQNSIDNAADQKEKDSLIDKFYKKHFSD